MEDINAALKKLLRTQLAAVNQQFVHMLALRVWGERAAAAKIGTIDDVDFPIAMRIMDHVVDEGEPLDLSFLAFAPGDTKHEVWRAEQAMETEMAQTGAFARAVARTAATPKAPPTAQLSIGEAPEEAIEGGRALAARCAAAAAAANDAEIGRGRREIEAFARRIVDHADGVHSALEAAAPVFRSFEKALARHVWSRTHGEPTP